MGVLARPLLSVGRDGTVVSEERLRVTTRAGGEKSLAEACPAVLVRGDRNVVTDDRVITSNAGPVSCQAAFQLLGRPSSEAFAK